MEDNITEDIYKYVQRFTDERTLITIGSGISSAEGIPGMNELAEELIKNVPKSLLFKEDDSLKWKKIELSLKEGTDLETSLSGERLNSNLDDIIKQVTYNYLKKYNEDLLQEVLTRAHKLKIESLLKKLTPRTTKELVVITTNYDCLIEYACAMLEIDVDTLFYGAYIKKFNPSLLRQQHMKYTGNKSKSQKKINYNFVKLLKPHGSLDWHSLSPNSDNIISTELNSPETVEMITPGISKYIRERREPFNKVYNLCNEEIDNAGQYIFLGYGFNDKDLEDHYEHIENRNKPMLIITKDLTKNINELYSKRNTIMLIYSNESGSNIKYKQSGEENKIHMDNNLWDIEILTKKIFNGEDN
ncbi:SIR2 family protein [Dellaglioa algida]|uniref:SIR2 family protein n=1 Tax=Dellaglioa algida TaxID=105612 RepID=UPI0024C49ABD|nr:SIR2 family protein [Dellaglioa algida]MDK1725809.1 SIR2 family protein [Dellaglioa algida]